MGDNSSSNADDATLTLNAHLTLLRMSEREDITRRKLKATEEEGAKVEVDLAEAEKVSGVCDVVTILSWECCYKE